MTNSSIPQETNLRYRRLFETAYDGILILDFDHGRIQDVNPYLIEMLGYSKEELIGMELWEIGAMVDKLASVKAFATLKKRVISNTVTFLCAPKLEKSSVLNLLAMLTVLTVSESSNATSEISPIGKMLKVL